MVHSIVSNLFRFYSLGIQRFNSFLCVLIKLTSIWNFDLFQDTTLQCPNGELLINNQFNDDCDRFVHTHTQTLCVVLCGSVYSNRILLIESNWFHSLNHRVFDPILYLIFFLDLNWTCGHTSFYSVYGSVHTHSLAHFFLFLRVWV